VAPEIAADLHRDDLSPVLARTLEDIAGGAFVISGWAYGVFVAIAAGSAFGSRVLPRWLATSGLVIGALTFVAGLAGALDPAAYVPIPFLLCLAWVLVVSVVWAIRTPLSRGTSRERATVAVPAEVSASA
jgi:hypothetical protein